MSEAKLISFNDIYPVLDSLVTPIAETEEVPLSESLGFVLAEDILSPLDVPQFNNSAMDGWAFSSEDIQADGFKLSRVGSSFAGHPYGKTVKSGECVRIMTGGQVPDGADTVVKQEIVHEENGAVVFPEGVQPGENVRRKGEEFTRGTAVLVRGTRIHAQQISFLAAIGIASVTVYRKPRVAFFSTGDELQPLGTPLQEAHIYDSNRYSIHAMLQEAGFDILDLGILPDNREALTEALRKAADCSDAIITSGGVSVGEADFTRSAVKSLGTIEGWSCLMRPGKPLAVGAIGDALFFGLPGNPTAAQCTFYMVVLHALRKLAGEAAPSLPIASAKLKKDVRKKPGYTEFQRGILSYENGEACVIPAGSQKTGMLSSLARANCFILLTDSDSGENARSGSLVRVIPFFGVCY
jgi:molybdopterin molybdotransferase